MSKKFQIDFLISGKVEATGYLGTLPVVDTKPKRGRKKKLAIEPEENEDYQEEVMPTRRTRGKADTSESSSTPSKGKKVVKEKEDSGKKTRGRPGRKKKNVEEEEEEQEEMEEEFEVPKAKPPAKGRGAKGRGRPKKEDSEDEDMASKESSKKGKEDISDEENLDIDEELDDEEEPIDEEEDEENYEAGLNNTLSTKDILRLTKGAPEDPDRKSHLTDINTLNIDVNKLTRRQKMQLKNQANLDVDIEEPLLELQDKRTKKKKDGEMTEEQQVKKMEEANKRRLLNQKMQEEQKKETIKRILNEAGRKQKQRKEKEESDLKGKDLKKFKSLPEGEVGIKYVSGKSGTFLVLPEGYDMRSLLLDVEEY